MCLTLCHVPQLVNFAGARRYEDIFKHAPPSTGTGGRKPTVDEMRVGGSGSCSVMNGVTVDTETVRARFVINCAGWFKAEVARL